MEDEMNEDLLEYLCDDYKDLLVGLYKEKDEVKMPYTRCTSDLFKKLKSEYGIDFDKELISTKLHDNMVIEILEEMKM